MKATARIRRQTRALGRMTRAMGNPRRVIPARSLSLTVGVLVLVGLLVLLSSFSSEAWAQSPVGDAWQTIVVATVEAQQTTNAQAAQAASQRATASALDIQMRQAAATATRAALDQAAADAQATRAAESARATQTAEVQATAQAVQATAAASQAHATATERARLAAAQAAQDAQATADAQATRAEATRAANETATLAAIRADATRTAFGLAAQNAQRDAQFQTIFSAGVIVIVWLLAAMLLFNLVRRLRGKPRPVVVVEPLIAEETGTPQGGMPPGAPNDAPQSYVVTDPQAAREIAQLIAREMGDNLDRVIPDETGTVDVEPKTTSTHSTE